MSDPTPVVATVSELREVVETFRRCAVLEPGWEEVVKSAAERLDPPRGDQIGDLSTRDVAARLRELLVAGAWADRALVDEVATDAAELIRLTWPAGLPRPEDEDWSFPRASLREPFIPLDRNARDIPAKIAHAP